MKSPLITILCFNFILKRKKNELDALTGEPFSYSNCFQMKKKLKKKCIGQNKCEIFKNKKNLQGVLNMNHEM